MRRVEAARHADAQPADVGRLQALHQPLHLDAIGLEAVLIESRGVARDEGEPLDSPAQADVSGGRLEVEDHAPEAIFGPALCDCSLVERAGSHTLELQPFDIDVGEGHLRLKREALGLSQQGPQLVDAGLPIPCEVSR